MKKALLSICSLLFAAAALSAQDVNQATDLFNNGATELSNGNNAAALSYFQKAHDMAASCGDAGSGIVSNCRNVIPQLNVKIAKDYIKAGNFDKAVAQLVTAKDVAAKFGADDVVAEAEAMIPQVHMQKGNTALKAKNYSNAIEAYKQVLTLNPENGRAALNMGMAYEASGNQSAAENAYVMAAANGQTKSANKKLANMYLRNAQALNKSGKYADAVAAALKSNGLVESANAVYIAGLASQNAGKKADAVKYFTKYLELSPAASNANDVRKVVENLSK